MILKPTGNSFDVYVYADFAGHWDPAETQESYTARSRHGFDILYAGCPLTWASQMQT
jgi:hypothetical protein